MGKPWIEDAKRYEAIDDVADVGIHQTAAIREFLAHDNNQRTVVLAPKGCGKTLLIKHKRHSLQNRGYEMLPSNQLVSLAPGYSPPFDDDRTRHIRENPQYWSTLWQIALAIAVLRSEPKTSLDLRASPLRVIVENKEMVDAFHIFVQLLYLQPREYFEVVKVFQAHLLPAFSRSHSQRALFIDNVDECFGHHLNREKRSGLHGQIANEFWHDAQVGLLMAVRQMAGHNPHVKIFATIRTEAFSARQSVIPDLANVRSHIVSIKFDYEDLKHIFEENIKQESDERLVEPNASDLFTRFVGREAVRIRHLYTGKPEHIFDYIYRHTLGRPRDFMTIGREISSLRRDRRTPEDVREAVNRAAAEIAKSYLTEVAPHFTWFDQNILFQQLDGNVLSPEDMRRVARSYDNTARKLESPWLSEGGNGASALADLYGAGLIGIVKPHQVTSGQVEHFESVFDMNVSVSRTKKELPASKSYLVHNVFGSYLRLLYTPDRWRAHTVNIIAPRKKWFEADGLMYVMQLDICESEIIRDDPVRGGAFRPIFDEAVKDALDSINFFEWVGGDGVALADRNGYVLIRAANQIARALKASMLNANVRVGLDFGPVKIGVNERGERRFEQGRPPVRSARLQAASAPDHLLTLPAVVETLAEFEVGWPFFDIALHHKDFRAQKTEQGWSIQEKSRDGEAEYVDRLVALNLRDLKIE